LQFAVTIVRVFAGRLAAKIARKDSLALKLALRPNLQELIARNIIHEESENERIENKEAIGARLIRYLVSVLLVMQSLCILFLQHC
jgi:hypothetical protein